MSSTAGLTANDKSLKEEEELVQSYSNQKQETTRQIIMVCLQELVRLDLFSNYYTEASASKVVLVLGDIQRDDDNTAILGLLD